MAQKPTSSHHGKSFGVSSSRGSLGSWFAGTGIVEARRPARLDQEEASKISTATRSSEETRGAGLAHGSRQGLGKRMGVLCKFVGVVGAAEVGDAISLSNLKSMSCQWQFAALAEPQFPSANKSSPSRVWIGLRSSVHRCCPSVMVFSGPGCWQMSHREFLPGVTLRLGSAARE